MYFKNRRDRERLEALQALKADARARADKAKDPRERAANLATARRMDHLYRTERSFPIGMWMLSAGIVAVMLPWGLLARQHHPVPGLIASGVVLVVLVSLELRSRRRRRARRAPAA
ncbi:MAG: hypothetical protein ABIQ09_19140 [Jatrophihabitantaceae bacterium]